MKTNKSYSKRLKVTGTGKIIGRKAGKDHFNAKESRQSQLHGKRSVRIIMKPKDRAQFLANS